METKPKNRNVESKNRRSVIKELIFRLDKQIEEIINYYVSQIEKTYRN